MYLAHVADHRATPSLHLFGGDPTHALYEVYDIAILHQPRSFVGE
jgi:hypothetical protein